jgi:HD-like signal output (HDOD) protein
MSQNQNIELEIAKIKNLPPLPEESIRIITAVNDGDISIEKLVDVLSMSPVLVARLLGLANSAFFGQAGKVNDLRTAIIRVLGVNLVKSLALSIVLNVELKTNECKKFDSNYFWSHALVTAQIAEKLAKHINDDLMQSNMVYTSGLLLNIGLLAAIFIYPADLNEVFSKSDRFDGSVINEMCSQLGKTQYEFGAILLERWKLPSIYQAVIKQFRQPDYEGRERRLIELLELSHWAAVYIVNDKIEEIPDFSNLLNRLSLSQVLFMRVVKDLNENRENILELATVVGGG